MIDLEELENIEVEMGEKITSMNYEDSYNKPQINGVELEGNKTTEDLGIEIPDVSNFITKEVDDLTNYYDKEEVDAKTDLSDYQKKINGSNKISSDFVDDTNSLNLFTTASEKERWNNKSDFSGNYHDLSNKPSIPTKTSDLNNDSGFIDKSVNNLDNYTKTSDLSTVATSGSYNDLSNKPTIPDELADLSDDSTHRLVSDTEKSTWNSKSDFSGSYNDLTDKPTIPTVPTNVSAFTNDAGYLTQHQDISGKLDTSAVKTSTNTTQGNVYDVTYINTMLGDVESLLGGI